MAHDVARRPSIRFFDADRQKELFVIHIGVAESSPRIVFGFGDAQTFVAFEGGGEQRRQIDPAAAPHQVWNDSEIELVVVTPAWEVAQATGANDLIEE